MKKSFIIISLLFLFFISSFSQNEKLSKKIDVNSKEIIKRGLIWSYGYNINNTYMLNYDYENSYVKNNEIRIDMMVYKLDYQKSEFIPASKPIDYFSKSKWSNKSIVCGYKLIKSHRNDIEYLNGNSSIKILDNNYILLTYKKYDLIDKNNTYNAIVLLKYDNENWIIEKHIKLRTKNFLLIDQYFYDVETNERKYLIHNNEVQLKFIQYGNTYIHLFIKGENLLM